MRNPSSRLLEEATPHCEILGYFIVDSGLGKHVAGTNGNRRAFTSSEDTNHCLSIRILTPSSTGLLAAASSAEPRTCSSKSAPAPHSASSASSASFGKKPKGDHRVHNINRGRLLAQWFRCRKTSEIWTLHAGMALCAMDSRHRNVPPLLPERAFGTHPPLLTPEEKNLPRRCMKEVKALEAIKTYKNANRQCWAGFLESLGIKNPKVEPSLSDQVRNVLYLLTLLPPRPIHLLGDPVREPSWRSALGSSSASV